MTRSTARTLIAPLWLVVLMLATSSAWALESCIIAPDDEAILHKDQEYTFTAIVHGFGDTHFQYQWDFEDTGATVEGNETVEEEDKEWGRAIECLHTCTNVGGPFTVQFQAWEDEGLPACNSITIYVVGLKITAVPDDDDRKTCVGRHHTFTATTEPEGFEVTDCQWSVGGARLKSYDTAGGTGSTTPLAPADLQNNSVSFHWYDGGTNTVGLTAKVNGIPMTAEAQQWTVQEPTDLAFSLTAGPDTNIRLYGFWLF